MPWVSYSVIQINKDLVDIRDVHFAAKELSQMHDCHGSRTLQVPFVCHLHRQLTVNCLIAPTDDIICSENFCYNKYFIISVETAEVMEKLSV